MQTSPPGPGDRLTDFLLTDQQGLPFSLSGGARGRAVLVLLCGDAGREPLQRLALQQAAMDEAGLDIVLITRASVAENAQGCAGTGAEFPVLADPDGATCRSWLAAAGRTAGPLGYLIDPNQRIIAVLDADADLTDVAALAAIADQPEIPPPVLFIPRVVDPDLRAELIGLWRAQNEEIGYSLGHGDDRDRAAKSSRDHVVRDPRMNNRLVDLVRRRVWPELERAFGLREALDFEVFVIIGYHSGRRDFFGPHRDNDAARMAHRRIAISINLNDEYEGGELQFPEYSLRGYRFPAGMAAVFGCGLLHQALPPVSGERFVLTTFLCDPEAA
ncbi:MAG: 2OG-Fe(II) oxygenase [Rhodospirillales bacterium]